MERFGTKSLDLVEVESSKNGAVFEVGMVVVTHSAYCSILKSHQSRLICCHHAATLRIPKDSVLGVPGYRLSHGAEFFHELRFAIGF